MNVLILLAAAESEGRVRRRMARPSAWDWQHLGRARSSVFRSCGASYYHFGLTGPSRDGWNAGRETTNRASIG